jgi:YgiT-type zinc finger domain-containing protein
MSCNNCGNREFEYTTTEEVFNMSGERILVHGIPVRLCTRCGEESFEPDVVEAVRILVNSPRDKDTTMEISVVDFKQPTIV